MDPATVEFRLIAGPNVTWRKVLNVPDGEHSSWDIFTQDAKRTDSVSLWAHQVNNGQRLTLSKARALGIVSAVVQIGDLDGLPAGSRLTFRWLAD